MKLRMTKFKEAVDIKGDLRSGANPDNGLDLYRAPSGDVIITWKEHGQDDEGKRVERTRQRIVGHANVIWSEPLEPVSTEPPGTKK